MFLNSLGERVREEEKKERDGEREKSHRQSHHCLIVSPTAANVLETMLSKVRNRPVKQTQIHTFFHQHHYKVKFECGRRKEWDGKWDILYDKIYL